MSPLLTVLGLVGVMLLIPRNRRNPVAPVITQTTPQNAGTGITTGFAPPPIQVSIDAPSTAPVQTNSPSTASSGVPNYSSNTQEFLPSQVNLGPGAYGAAVPYYPGPISKYLESPYGPLTKPITPKQGCSCGGSCSGSCSNVSQCSISQFRNNDAGCLSPTEQATINNTPPPVLQAWAANLQSAGTNLWQAEQQHHYEKLVETGSEHDNSIPASPFLQGIGVNPSRPIHSAVAGGGF